MPFIIPVKRKSMTKRKTFSKYKQIDQSADFILEKRKNYLRMPKTRVRPPYRIITKGVYPIYEVAYGSDLESLRADEWQYILHDLPPITPPHLVGKHRVKWFVAHFTQRALEKGNDQKELDTDDESDLDGDRKSRGALSDHSDGKSRGNSKGGMIKRGTLSNAYDNSNNDKNNHNNNSNNNRSLGEQQPWFLRGKRFFFPLVLSFNLAAVVLRDTGFVGFCLTLAVFNILFYFVVWRGDPFSLGVIIDYGADPYDYYSGVGHRRTRERRTGVSPVDSATGLAVNVEDMVEGVEGSGDEEAIELERRKSQINLTGPKLPIGYTLTRLPDEAFFQDVKTYQDNSYTMTQGSEFNVRQPPNYKRNKMKAPSEQAFYECIGMDVFKCPCKINGIGTLFQLPELDLSDSKDNNNNNNNTVPGFPETLIIQYQLPSYAPSIALWGKAVEDGEGWGLVHFFKLADWVKDSYRRGHLDTDNSVDLARRFFAADNNENKLRDRLKGIPKVVNTDDLNNISGTLRAVLKSYNAKPFLTGPDPECHRFRWLNENVFEIDIDVHRFCYMARKGAYGFIDLLRDMVIDMGFVIEGHGDDEQPERMLACARYCKLDPHIQRAIQVCQDEYSAEKKEHKKDK